MSIHFVVATSTCLQSTVILKFQMLKLKHTLLVDSFILTFEYFHKIRGNVTEKSEVKDVIYRQYGECYNL